MVLLSLLVTGIVVRNTLVTYDREHEKIGFWKTNCSELWERLHSSPAPPPLPSDTDAVNSTTNVAPTLAPSEAPPPKAPGIISYYFSFFQLSLPCLSKKKKNSLP